MVKQLGILFGLLFLLGGLLGFVPGVTTDHMFLGIFMVNTAHGVMHIASGVVFLFTSVFGATAARLWFQIFGMIYAATAAIGFWVGDAMIFGLISNNLYDSCGHAALALVMLLIGFAIPQQSTASGTLTVAKPYTSSTSSSHSEVSRAR
jgi:hypothetical protein